MVSATPTTVMAKLVECQRQLALFNLEGLMDAIRRVRRMNLAKTRPFTWDFCRRLVAHENACWDRLIVFPIIIR